MIRFLSCLLISAACVCTGPVFAVDPAAGLSPTQLDDLRASVKMDAATRAAMNAVSNNDLKDLALNRSIVMTNDDLFSLSLPTKGITDQESTGRCWMFAGLNTMRQSVIKKYKLEDFELSQSYLAFYDKLEKANVFLESPGQSFTAWIASPPLLLSCFYQDLPVCLEFGQDIEIEPALVLLEPTPNKPQFLQRFTFEDQHRPSPPYCQHTKFYAELQAIRRNKVAHY